MMNMIGSQEVLDALKNIGLNLYERKIYLALLAKGVATAGVVSVIAKVPRSRSYDVLESLADKGFVVAQSSKPIKYVALAPKDAIERAKDNMGRKHNESIARMDKMTKSPVMNELEGIYKEGLNMIQPFDIAGTLKGRASINQQIKSLFKKASQYINVITTEDGLKDLHSNHFKSLKKASKSGVRLRVLAPKTNSSHASAFSEIGEIKGVEKPMGRLFTVDGEHFMLALTDDKSVHQSQDVAFWAGSGHVAKDVFEPMFESFWSLGK
jgi:sugar-specific transcriptional regulator TrmB